MPLCFLSIVFLINSVILAIACAQEKIFSKTELFGS